MTAHVTGSLLHTVALGILPQRHPMLMWKRWDHRSCLPGRSRNPKLESPGSCHRAVKAQPHCGFFPGK